MQNSEFSKVAQALAALESATDETRYHALCAYLAEFHLSAISEVMKNSDFPEMIKYMAELFGPIAKKLVLLQVKRTGIVELDEALAEHLGVVDVGGGAVAKLWDLVGRHSQRLVELGIIDPALVPKGLYVFADKARILRELRDAGYGQIDLAKLSSAQ